MQLVKKKMAHYTQLFSCVNNSLSDLVAKVNKLDIRVNALSPVQDQSTKPQWVDQNALDNTHATIKSVESGLRSTIADVKSSINQLKDDLAKERAATENATVLKLEHFVAKCVKERLELAMQGVKQVVDDNVKQKMDEAVSELKDFVVTQIAVQTPPPIAPPAPVPTPPPSAPVPVMNTTLTSLSDISGGVVENATFETSIDIDSLTKTSTGDQSGSNDPLSDPGDIQIKKRGYRKVIR